MRSGKYFFMVYEIRNGTKIRNVDATFVFVFSYRFVFRTTAMITLSAEEARIIALEAQGLASAFPFGKGKKGALETIRHLGYIQLDTLAVVARAHHHTLWTRPEAYSENHLAEL